ncbi:MAG TPA: phosphatase PAP2 family protein [Thermoanaerobaculia bacterium]|nr:phosphatase PAP2 family protein [Thermoanaerobaculia bacterium]
MSSRKRHAFRLLLFTSSVSVFVVVVKRVATGKARPRDESLRRKITSLQSPEMDIVSTVLTVATAPALLVASSLAVAFRLRHLGANVWLPLASAPLVAMTAGRCFTEILPQQYSPTSKDGKREPCFPSGHTTGATTEMLTIAYVLERSGVINTPVAMAIALAPIAGALNRLYRDRHWTSDIVAGLSAGTAIATVLSSISD